MIYVFARTVAEAERWAVKEGLDLRTVFTCGESSPPLMGRVFGPDDRLVLLGPVAPEIDAYVRTHRHPDAPEPERLTRAW